MIVHPKIYKEGVMDFLLFVSTFVAGMCTQSRFASVVWGMSSGIWLYKLISDKKGDN